MNVIKKLLLACALTCSIAHPKALFWDLGYTLFEADYSKLAMEMGGLEYLWYSIWDGRNSDDLKHAVLATLAVSGLQEGDEEIMVRDNGGNIASMLFVEWQLGFKTSDEVLQEALENAEKLHAKDFYHCNREYRLVKKALNCMFEPELLARSMTPIKKHVKLLKACAEEVDEDGNPCHQLFVFSNWDPESFNKLKTSKHGQKIFKFFEDHCIIVSGHDKVIKPHDCIFEYTMDKFNLDAEECVLIDDQAENRRGAERNGWIALNPEENLKEQLIEYGILKT